MSDNRAAEQAALEAQERKELADEAMYLANPHRGIFYKCRQCQRIFHDKLSVSRHREYRPGGRAYCLSPGELIAEGFTDTFYRYSETDSEYVVRLPPHRAQKQ